MSLIAVGKVAGTICSCLHWTLNKSKMQMKCEKNNFSVNYSCYLFFDVGTDSKGGKDQLFWNLYSPKIKWKERANSL